jgi:hypothetical protein
LTQLTDFVKKKQKKKLMEEKTQDSGKTKPASPKKQVRSRYLSSQALPFHPRQVQKKETTTKLKEVRG